MEQITNSILLTHWKFKLFIFKLSAKKFIEYSKIERRYDNMNKNIEVNQLWVQRKLNLEKVKKIRSYILEKDSTIPASFIVNICTNDNYNEKFKTNSSIEDNLITLNWKDLIVIDWQHRLAALDYNTYKFDWKYDELSESEKNKLDEMEVIIVGYKDISLIDMADIFITINYNQKRVSKSIIYDLLNLVESDFYNITTSQEDRFFWWVSHKEFRAASIVDDLNEDSNSYWNNLIKVEWWKWRTIEKWSFVENLAKLFNKNRIFWNDKISNSDIYYILCNFYNIFLETIYYNSKNDLKNINNKLEDNYIDIYNEFRNPDYFLAKPSWVWIILDENIFDRIVKKTFDFDKREYKLNEFNKIIKNLNLSHFLVNNPEYNFKWKLSSRAWYKEVVNYLSKKLIIND